MRTWLAVPLITWLAACGGAPFEQAVPEAEGGAVGPVQDPEAGLEAGWHSDAPVGAQEGGQSHEADAAPDAGAGDAEPDGGPSEAGAVGPEAGITEAGPSCDPTSCPSGCCSAGACVSPSQHECGQQGQACNDCGSGGPPYNLMCGAQWKYLEGVQTYVGGTCCEQGQAGCE